MAGFHASNIEPSATRAGEYVGYAHGVWRIKRGETGSWNARKMDGQGYIFTRTLREMNTQLMMRNI